MKPANTLGPSQVARATGVSPDTLRHYERRGLLPPPVRTNAGYRRYSQSTVARVELIQRALVIGFSLEELVDVLAERDSGGAPCRQRQGRSGPQAAEEAQAWQRQGPQAARPQARPATGAQAVTGATARSQLATCTAARCI